MSAKKGWSGDFPPPGAGDGKVRLPPPEWGCLRVVAPVVIVAHALVGFWRTFVGDNCVTDGSCCREEEA